MDTMGDSPSRNGMKEMDPFMGSQEISLNPPLIHAGDMDATSCTGITLELSVPQSPGVYHFNTAELAKDVVYDGEGPLLLATSSTGSDRSNSCLESPSSFSSPTSDDCNKPLTTGRKRNFLYQLDPTQEKNEKRQRQIDRAKQLKQFHEKKKRASQVNPHSLCKTLEILESMESICETMISGTSPDSAAQGMAQMDGLVNEIRLQMNS